MRGEAPSAGDVMMGGGATLREYLEERCANM